MELLFLAALAALGYCAGRFTRRYLYRHRGPDRALRIVPPRRYVDADGCSVYRPDRFHQAYSKPAELVDAELHLRTEKP